VLFLHGIGGNRSAWDDQVRFFSRTYTAAAWDARGYGDSDDYEGPLDFRDFCADLVRVLNFLESGTAHVVGLSMGGRIARSFALQHPGRVKSLVLANTSPGFDALSPEQVAAFVEQRRTLDPMAQAKRLLAPGARMEAFERLIASLRAVHRDCYLKTVEASVSQDVAAPLERIAVPTLVIASDQDRLYPPDIGRGMARRIPGARFTLLPGGHLSNLEQPERFNAAVLEFLDTVEKRS
jgi:3-oxoadipate enol-lactonase